MLTRSSYPCCNNVDEYLSRRRSWLGPTCRSNLGRVEWNSGLPLRGALLGVLRELPIGLVPCMVTQQNPYITEFEIALFHGMTLRYSKLSVKAFAFDVRICVRGNEIHLWGSCFDFFLLNRTFFSRAITFCRCYCFYMLCESRIAGNGILNFLFFWTMVHFSGKKRRACLNTMSHQIRFNEFTHYLRIIKVGGCQVGHCWSLTRETVEEPIHLSRFLLFLENLKEIGCRGKRPLSIDISWTTIRKILRGGCRASISAGSGSSPEPDVVTPCARASPAGTFTFLFPL